MSGNMSEIVSEKCPECPVLSGKVSKMSDHTSGVIFAPGRTAKSLTAVLEYPQTVSVYRILAFESLRIHILDLPSIHKVSMYPCVSRMVLLPALVESACLERMRLHTPQLLEATMPTLCLPRPSFGAMGVPRLSCSEHLDLRVAMLTMLRSAKTSALAPLSEVIVEGGCFSRDEEARRGRLLSGCCITTSVVVGGHTSAADTRQRQHCQPRGPRLLPGSHGREHWHASLHLDDRVYTLGPALRIPNVKNMGKDLALEELRICPWPRGRRS